MTSESGATVTSVHWFTTSFRSVKFAFFNKISLTQELCNQIERMLQLQPQL